MMTGSHEDSEDCPEVEEYEGYELEQWEYQQDFSLQLQDFEDDADYDIFEEPCSHANN
jgi:hypothetical protein